MEAGDVVAVLVDDAAGRADLEAAVGEGDATGDGVGLERWCVEFLCPIRLGQSETVGTFAVFDGRVERC
jgi:hypothetical protein